MKNNWMVKALILGTVFFIAALIVKPIGVSTQFSVVSGIVHSSIDSNVIVNDEDRESGYKSSNEYYDLDGGKLANNIKNPLNYDLIFVLAIPLGGYIGYLSRRKSKNEGSNKTCKVQDKKASFIKTYLPSFIGGFLLLYGARMAGGCTSGHMMSGMMQGAVSGYIFAGAVFIVAIPTAIFMRKYRLKKGE